MFLWFLFLFLLVDGWNSIVSVFPKYKYIFYCIKSLIFLLIKTKHLCGAGYNMLKLCNVLIAVQFAENQNGTWYLRPWTKHFRQTLGFMWKKRITGRFEFLFFINILLLLTKFSSWKEELALVYNSIFDIFLIFLNSCGNTRIPFLLLTITLYFTCGKGKIW